MNGNRPLAVLAAIAVIFLLYFGGPFFIPLFLSLLISNALSPVVSALTAIVRVRVLAAAIVVLSILALLGLAAWSWTDDVQAMWEEVPAAARSISRSLQGMVRKPAGPITEVKKAAAELESAAQGKAATTSPAPQPAAPTPSMWQMVWTGWKGVMLAASQVMVVSFLVFFMLASGDFFKRRLLSIAAERNKARFTLKVMEEIDDQVRRYLGVLLIANILVGVGTWFVFWAFGMKYPGLWGLAAGVIHTAPYFGPALIAVASLVIAFVQFGDWGRALLISGSSILVATLVGSIFATWLASKRTRMNTTASFIGLLFFGWLWGFWGILLAIPLLAVAKTICEHNEDWKPAAELLGR